MNHADAPATGWQNANQRALAAALKVVRLRLEMQARATGREEGRDVEAAEKESAELTGVMSPAPAFVTLGKLFGLSPFERAVLLLCAGMELESSFAAVCAAAHGNPQQAYPTFGLALATLPEAHWSALAPDAGLRYWRLIEFGQGGSAGAPVTTRPLRVDERILHYLTGLSQLDDRLVASEAASDSEYELMPSQEQIAQRVAMSWSQVASNSVLPIALLCGPDKRNNRAVAARVCALRGHKLRVVSAEAIPSGVNERTSFIRLWERESVLGRSVLLLDHHDCSHTDPVHENAASDFVERIRTALIISSRQRPRLNGRPSVEFEVKHPTSGEQRDVWSVALGDLASSLNGGLDVLTSQFSLSVPSIRSAVASARGTNDAGRLNDALWDQCRVVTRARMDDLAQRIEGTASWDDLVLPEAQKGILREIVAHVRQRNKVYESWGFGDKGGRGLGISAVFAGTSGTGKTMAAEVLARSLRLDLYRIDLSSVVSKYIGETEKNLRRLFDAAEEGGSILLFDEADALFGKRSEVKDSHDRYANIEVSYLLQRMECYRGLAILTTNFKAALDAAFMRRIRFVIQFPFPDASQRAEIWQRIFPPNTPTRGLELQKLAQLNVPGGNIRNIAMNGAFLAANEDSHVHMSHLLRAARSEYAKLEKTLTEAEIQGWE